ncbi:hypothetical protein R1flu_007344 [Riccia fluitans]|uniref:Uncharacterized protein n=1 Tax=Riccia fluitans TaxID=41844 RepID=A0ABD1YYU9_9MARC
MVEAIAYQGDLLELQKAAFAIWKVEYEEHLATLSKLSAAMKIEEEKLLLEGAYDDPLIHIQKLARVKELRKLKEFKALPYAYDGQLLELQDQILRRWKNSAEYKALLSKKQKRLPLPGIQRDLLWWEWIPISAEYKGKKSDKNVPQTMEEPGIAGFQSVEYKVESGKKKSQKWDNQTKEPYKSLEYNKILADKAKIVIN